MFNICAVDFMDRLYTHIHGYRDAAIPNLHYWSYFYPENVIGYEGLRRNPPLKNLSASETNTRDQIFPLYRLRTFII